MKKMLWLFPTLVLLIGTNWYYKQSIPNIKLDAHSLSTTIDTTISQLKVKQFNESGELVNLLTTPLMEHIPQKNTHLLKTPHVVIKDKDQPAWDIRSERAKSIAGGSQITFIQKVIVRQKADKPNQESTLKTEKITYFPKEKKATTNLFVTYEQPGNIVESTGMNAYLDEKRVELLHGAKGLYAPSTKG